MMFNKLAKSIIWHANLQNELLALWLAFNELNVEMLLDCDNQGLYVHFAYQLYFKFH